MSTSGEARSLANTVCATYPLRAWATQCPRPLVLAFDEIDALQGESLRSVLRQLRDMHRSRPNPSPHSIILCGLRDVRDYKAASGGDPSRLGTSSPFNVKVESVRIGDFDQDEVRSLLRQHTEDTGQPFERVRFSPLDKPERIKSSRLGSCSKRGSHPHRRLAADG